MIAVLGCRWKNLKWCSSCFYSGLFSCGSLSSEVKNEIQINIELHLTVGFEVLCFVCLVGCRWSLVVWFFLLKDVMTLG